MKNPRYPSIKSIGLAALVPGALLLTGAAHAGICDLIPVCDPSAGGDLQEIYEENIYSGTGCKPAYGSRWDDFELNISEIHNISGEIKAVVCPVVRHYPEQGRHPLGFAVGIYNPGIDYLGCTLYVQDGEGNIVSSNSVSTRISGNHYLLNPDRSAATRHNGATVLYCSLPAGGKILNYRIHEFMGYRSN